MTYPIIVGLLMGFIVYMMIRNQIVYNYTMSVLHDTKYLPKQQIERYRRLPSHHKMMWQIWKFNWNDYLET